MTEIHLVMLVSTSAVLAGALLDRAVGDPRSLPHLVRGLGRLIEVLEASLWQGPADPVTERARGRWLVLLVVGSALLISGLLLAGAYTVSLWLGWLVETLLCWQCLAVKSLRDESMAVWQALVADDLAGARQAVSMIVGRDTAGLDQAGVARAAVETVAENTTDAVVAPLLAMGLAGGVGAVVYKAINTLDSMVGYRNQRYRHFGRAGARLDDWATWPAARCAAWLMVVAAGLTGQDWRGAWRIWRRDRRNHPSPNSAQTEAVCAGALGLQLGGSANYGGQLVDKPTIGDWSRPVGTQDIVAANHLMSRTAWLGLALVLAGRLAVWAVVSHVM